MKAAFLAFLLFLSGTAFAERWLSNRSSRTITADTLVRIPNSNPGDTISSVIITSCSIVPGSVFTLYDSSGQASRLISQIHTSTSPSGTFTASCIRQYDYFIRVSSAITYTTTFAADVTILWHNDIGAAEQ